MDLRLPTGSRSSDADRSEIDGGIPLDEDHSNLSCKEASIKARVKIDFGAFDLTDFAKFLRTHASEWLNSRQQPCWTREHGEHLP